jgi:hypothetical protein
MTTKPVMHVEALSRFEAAVRNGPDGLERYCLELGSSKSNPIVRAFSSCIEVAVLEALGEDATVAPSARSAHRASATQLVRMPS